MQKLLGIQADRQIEEAVANGHMAEIDDARDYEVGNHPGPTLQPLRPFWDAPKSLWNKQLAELFADYLTAKQPGYDTERTVIIDHFLQRIATFRRLLHTRIPIDAQETDAEAGARFEEQQQLSLQLGRTREHRSRVSLAFPALRVVTNSVN